MTALSDAINRLSAGYYNSGAVSLANPGGMDADGHVTNFPAMLVDQGLVAGLYASLAGVNLSAVLNGYPFTGDVLRTGAAGTRRKFALQTAGLDRWGMEANTTAEGGANAGSNFELRSYSDAGALIETPMSISRATGQATLKALALTTDLAVTEGGTGASTAAAARDNLGVGWDAIGSGAGSGSSFFAPSLASARYSVIKIFVSDLEPTVNGATIFGRVSVDNQSSVISSANYYYNQFYHANGTGGYLTGNGVTSFQLTGGLTSGVNYGSMLEIDLLSSVGANPKMKLHGVYTNAAGNEESISGGGRVNGTGAATTDLNIGVSSGTFSYRWAAAGMRGS